MRGNAVDRFMEEMEHWPHGMVVKAVHMKKTESKREKGRRNVSAL